MALGCHLRHWFRCCLIFSGTRDPEARQGNRALLCPLCKAVNRDMEAGSSLTWARWKCKLWCHFWYSSVGLSPTILPSGIIGGDRSTSGNLRREGRRHTARAHSLDLKWCLAWETFNCEITEVLPPSLPIQLVKNTRAMHFPVLPLYLREQHQLNFYWQPAITSAESKAQPKTSGKCLYPRQGHFP